MEDESSSELVFPPDLAAFFTTTEIEEIKQQFITCDVDKSGKIDEQELFESFQLLDVRISAEELSKMMAELDDDGNGLLDFNEYVMMMHKAKAGDPRFIALSDLSKNLNATPVSILKDLAAKHRLHVYFHLVEEREANAYHPKLYVMEVVITREKKENVEEELNVLVRCQGLAPSSRVAKYKAAESALLQVQNLKPGMQFAHGVVPPDWWRWTLTNIARGVSPAKCITTLSRKGFFPSLHELYMEQVFLRASACRLSKRCPALCQLPSGKSGQPTGQDLGNSGQSGNSEMKLQHTWVSWIQNHVSDGFQVKLVFQELERLGFDLTKHPALIQRFLKRQKSGSASDYSPPYCFTHALRQNNAGRVQCYLAGGFDPNAPLFDATTQQHIRPLHQAAKLGFLSVVKTLLTSKCQVNARDAFGRTALFGAVQSNQLEVVTYLCQEAKASLTTVDNLGNTCLHVAAKNGHASMVNFLLTYHHDCIRKVLVNDIPVTQEDPVHTSFATIVRETYEAMIAKYVSRREKRHFDEAWIYEAIKWIYEKINHAEIKVWFLHFPSNNVIDCVRQRLKIRLSDDPENEFSTDNPATTQQRVYKKRLPNGNFAHINILSTSMEFTEIVEHAYREAWINHQNVVGQTPLHLACDENKICSHEAVLELLCSKFGAWPNFSDNFQRKPREYLLLRRGRPGTPESSSMKDEEAFHQIRIQMQNVKKGQEGQLKREEIIAQWDAYLLSLSPTAESSETTADTQQRKLRELLRGDAVLLRKVGDWKEFLDSGSKNRLYENTQTGIIQWTLPQEIIHFSTKRQKWSQRRRGSQLLKKTGEWEMRQDTNVAKGGTEPTASAKGRVFFYNQKTGEHQWEMPEVLASWNGAQGIVTENLDENKDGCIEEREDDDSDSDELSEEDMDEVRNVKRDAMNSVDLIENPSLDPILRRFGEWEEHQDHTTSTVYYVNRKTKEKTWTAPQAVHNQQAIQQSYAKLKRNSILLTNVGSWEYLAHRDTEKSFYFNTETGEGRHDLDAPAEVLKHEEEEAQKLKDRKITAEEIHEGLEKQKWIKDLRRQKRQMKRKSILEMKRSMNQMSVNEGEMDEQDVSSDEDEVEDDMKHMQREEKEEQLRLETELNEWNDLILQNIRTEHHGKSLVYLQQRAELEQKTLQEALARGIFTTKRIQEEQEEQEEQAKASETKKAMDLMATFEREERAFSQLGHNTQSSPRSRERRRVLRLIERMDNLMAREGYWCCKWGCRLWFTSESKNQHETSECHRRLLTCRLGCGTILDDYEWRLKDDKDNQVLRLTRHETEECPQRLVECPLNCGMYVSFLNIPHHTKEECPKRPVPDVVCRVGCGQIFEAKGQRLIELEQLRLVHELDECLARDIKCDWPGCDRGKLPFAERIQHRKSHLFETGLQSFRIPGEDVYVVPPNVKKLKLQVWGAGGGGGHLRQQKAGHGGGGAFIEGILMVEPGEKLSLVVGAGGGAGVHGTLEQTDDESADQLMVNVPGKSVGGYPGGGAGYGGNREWAGGAGGGYTCLSRKSAFGVEMILIAAGGGGGGCRNGIGGGGLHGEDGLFEVEDLDIRNGRLGTQEAGGAPGAPSLAHRIEATAGEQYQGGDGAEFGGGGGGGYFGGGGGSAAPGIAGAGAGGSCYLNEKCFTGKVVITRGISRTPGGLDRCPPGAVGIAEWDTLEGVAGEGAKGSKYHVSAGNSGAVRIALPGFFHRMNHGCENQSMISSKVSPRVDLLTRASTSPTISGLPTTPL